MTYKDFFISCDLRGASGAMSAADRTGVGLAGHREVGGELVVTGGHSVEVCQTREELNRFSAGLESCQQAIPLVHTPEKSEIEQMTDAGSLLLRHRYATQIVLILFVSALFTYGVVVLGMLPSPWNALWMLVLPAFLGIALNRGLGQLTMVLVLPVASLVGTAVVGNAMGGM